MTWREAMARALYGPGGFYVSGDQPARHFRTSPQVSPVFAGALLAILREVDAALGRPGRLDLVDIGAGDGDLLAAMLSASDGDPDLAGRVAAHAVEVRARPAGLDRRIVWRTALPTRLTGLVVANEWLDNVPVDVVELTAGGPRVLLVDRAGAERPGPAPSPPDLAWLRRWWPLRRTGDRAEIGWPRCRAWADVIRRLDGGLAVAIDYGHRLPDRPAGGTVAGYQWGRRTPAIPDGAHDITAHVAVDACADAGAHAGAVATVLATQRDALRALGVSGRRPPPARAVGDPAGYVCALAGAGAQAELIDPAGLGSFTWLAQAVRMPVPATLTAAAR